MRLPRWLRATRLIAPRPAGRFKRHNVLGRTVRLLGCVALLWGFHGATNTRNLKRLRPGANRPDRAWMNAKGMCVFPLAGDEIPRTGGQLAESLLGGWRDIFSFPDRSHVVELTGGRYPAIDTVTVDLSGAVANPRHKSAPIPDPIPSSRSLAVNHFSMVAEPLLSHRAKINMRVTGTGVRFDLQHDKQGKPILMLADAREGMLHFDVSRADLERLMLAQAKEAAATQALIVRSVDFDLDELGPRSLKADLHVSTLVGFIPAGLRFTARVDIDEQMNARISDLACDGDEVLGPLIVNFIRPGLAKYNGKTKPLVAFPSGNLKLSDVQVRGGERIELTARFGN
jgi:hypothetical protein